jgi:hypothetical protein
MGPFFKVTLTGLALQGAIDCVQDSLLRAQQENDFHKIKELKSIYNSFREQLEKEGLLFIINDNYDED